MPTENASRRPRPADRRAQLVNHASTLFADRGYPAVALADIARAAGVTAPALYRHFADKQSILAAAVLAGVDELEACTARALTAPAGIDELIASVSALGVRRPAAVSLWRSASRHLTPEQNREVILRTREVVHRWADVVAATTQASPRDSVEICWAVLSVIGSLGVHHSRLSAARAAAELEILVHRLIALRPASAPGLAAVPPAFAGTTTRRDEILDAAAALFAERGYTGVGVDDIGAAVGITGPSVYKHFSSKLAILIGIGQRGAARLEAGAVAAHAVVGPDPARLLALLVDSYVAEISSTPDLSVGFTNSYACAGQPSAVGLLDAQRRYVARWIDLEGQLHPGLRRAQAAVAVHAALSVVNDAVRVRRGTHRADFPATMAYLMKGILGA
ncbi:MAG: helix-turn-helix domain-containing protein [Gordonia sp. (in: high G+C Gram-positive bacteria)]